MPRKRKQSPEERLSPPIEYSSFWGERRRGLRSGTPFTSIQADSNADVEPFHTPDLIMPEVLEIGIWAVGHAQRIFELERETGLWSKTDWTHAPHEPELSAVMPGDKDSATTATSGAMRGNKAAWLFWVCFREAARWDKRRDRLGELERAVRRSPDDPCADDCEEVDKNEATAAMIATLERARQIRDLLKKTGLKIMELHDTLIDRNPSYRMVQSEFWMMFEEWSFCWDLSLRNTLTA